MTNHLKKTSNRLVIAGTFVMVAGFVMMVATLVHVYNLAGAAGSCFSDCTNTVQFHATLYRNLINAGLGMMFTGLVLLGWGVGLMFKKK